MQRRHDSPRDVAWPRRRPRWRAWLLAACGEQDRRRRRRGIRAAASPNGSILFVAGGNINLWDGRRQEAHDGFRAAFPTWSPTADRFAYIKMSDAFSELYIADRSGKDLQKLTNDEPADEPYTEDFAFNAAWAVDPDWSPKSDQIAFISDKGGQDPYSDIMSLWFAERWDVQADPYPLTPRRASSTCSPRRAFRRTATRSRSWCARR